MYVALKKIALAGVAAIFAATANADALLNFDGLNTVSDGYINMTQYSEGGFTFSGTTSAPHGLISLGPNLTGFAEAFYTGSRTLAIGVDNAGVTLTSSNGAAFSLESIVFAPLAHWANGFMPRTIMFNGQRADGSWTSETVSIFARTDGDAMQLVTFQQMSNLIRVTWQDSFTQFDNVQLRGDFIASPVPEPSTYALLLVGLALVGWKARARAHFKRPSRAS